MVQWPQRFWGRAIVAWHALAHSNRHPLRWQGWQICTVQTVPTVAVKSTPCRGSNPWTGLVAICAFRKDHSITGSERLTPLNGSLLAHNAGASKRSNRATSTAGRGRRTGGAEGEWIHPKRHGRENRYDIPFVAAAMTETHLKRL